MPDGLIRRCDDVMKLIDPSYEVTDGYLPPICCWSCHDDEDDGYPLLNPTVNGGEADVCCAIARAWEAHCTRGSRA
jgi:hypothetical protein